VKILKSCALIVLFFILLPSSRVYAISPPYGFGTRGCKYELQERLQEYIDLFMEGGNNFAGRPFGHGNNRRNFAEYSLVHRHVIFPSVTDPDFFLYDIFFSEERWGDGINRSSFLFVERGTRWAGYLQDRSYIGVSFRYGYKNPLSVYRTRFSLNDANIVSVHEGVYNGNLFYGYSFTMPNGNIFSMYNVVVGDVLVTITKSRPFSESYLSLVVFEKIDIILPVYVQIAPLTVSSRAVEDAGQAQLAGPMSGVSDNTFAPQQPFARERSIMVIIISLVVVWLSFHTPA